MGIEFAKLCCNLGMTYIAPIDGYNLRRFSCPKSFTQGTVSSLLAKYVSNTLPNLLRTYSETGLAPSWGYLFPQ